MNEIVWESKDKEIILHNNLFDVKTITYNNNKAIITGWYDDAEDEVDIAINKQNQPSKQEKSTLPYFNNIFCEPINNFEIKSFKIFETKNYFANNNSLHNIALQIIAPPPRA